jgi:peptidyl-prolyl cis-trans isomerase C
MVSGGSKIWFDLWPSPVTFREIDNEPRKQGTIMNRLVQSAVVIALSLCALPVGAETNTAAAATATNAVASVNGTFITRGELDEAVEGMSRRMMQMGQSLDSSQRNAMEQGMLDQLIGERLMVQKSAAVKVDGLEAKVQEQIAGIKKQFPDEKAFEELLKARGMTVAQLQVKIGEGVRIEALIDQDVRSKIKVAEADAKEFYDKNPKYFSQPAQVRASHILVKFPEDADDKVKTEKKKAIDAARTRVVGGEDFAKVAAEVSDCPSKAQGGDLDFFGPGQMVKPFEEAAFGLKSNEVSQVVTTPFGYHIIKQTGSKPAATTPFEQEQTKINEYLTQQKMREAVMAYVAALRKDAKVEVLLK